MTASRISIPCDIVKPQGLTTGEYFACIDAKGGHVSAIDYTEAKVRDKLKDTLLDNAMLHVRADRNHHRAMLAVRETGGGDVTFLIEWRHDSWEYSIWRPGHMGQSANVFPTDKTMATVYAKAKEHALQMGEIIWEAGYVPPDRK